jgi:hypothetical protein
MSGLNNKHFFLTVLEAGSPASRCQKIQCLVYRWPSSCSDLPHMARKDRELVLFRELFLYDIITCQRLYLLILSH